MLLRRRSARCRAARLLSLCGVLGIASATLPLREPLQPASPPAPPALVVYVSTTGSDAAGDGTLGRPFASPARGAAAVQQACAPLPCAGGASLLLRGGRYLVGADAPLALRGASASGDGARILVSSFPGELAELTGAAPVALSPPPPDDPVLPFLSSDAARARVLAGSFPACGGAGVVACSDLALFHDDRPQVAARWPDDPVALAWAAGDPSLGAAQGRADCADAAPAADEPFVCAGWARSRPEDNWTWDRIRASPSAPFAAWRWNASAWRVRGLFAYDWDGDDSSVARFDPANGTVLLSQPWSDAGYWGGARYFAVGAPEALSAGGEFFVNPSGGSGSDGIGAGIGAGSYGGGTDSSGSGLSRVYWLPPERASQQVLPRPPGWPPAAPAAANATAYSMSVSTTPSLVALTNCSGVTVSLLHMWGCTGACVVVANCSDTVVAQNLISGAGVRAVDAHFPLNVRVNVSANVIAHTGADAVWLDGGSATLLEPANSTVADNVIADFGRLSFSFAPAVGVDGCGTAAERNLALSGPACGIMFGGPLQRVEANVVVDALRGTFDMGVLCDGPRDWTLAPTSLRGNALLRNGFTPLLSNHVTDPLRTGLYSDYGNFAHDFVGNVVWQPPHPATPAPALVPRAPATRSWAAYNHGGRNFNASNNVLVDIAGVQANGAGLEGGDKAMLANGSHYFAALEACGGHAAGGWRQPPCSERVPGLAALAGTAPATSAECALAWASCGAAPGNNTVTLNVALTPSGNGSDFFVGPAEADVPVDVSRNLIDPPDAGFAAGAAGFRDALDFDFAATSPVWSLGFERIASELWGPRWLTPPGAWRDAARAAVPWALCPAGREAGCVGSGSGAGGGGAEGGEGVGSEGGGSEDKR
jgi:hypothetical protein